MAMFDGFTKEDFQKAIEANPDAWRMPFFTGGVQQINESYQQQVDKIGRSGQYDRQSEILDATSHLRVNAGKEVEGLMQSLGVTQDDLKLSQRGSDNDLYMDLGVGNLQLHDVADVEMGQAVGNPNFRNTAAQGGELKTTSDQLGNYTMLEEQDEKLDEVALGLIAAAATGGVAATTWSPLVSAIAKGAAVSGGMNAVQGGDLESTLVAGAKGGVTGGLTHGLTEIPGVGNVLKADNFGGAFASGATNDLVKQAIMTGEISLEDAAKAGLINMGVETAKDVYDDTVFTADGNLEVDVDKVNHKLLTDNATIAAETGRPLLSDISNSTDLYGLLGNEGALSQLTGWDIGRMPTTWLGNGLKALGLADRPIYDPDNAEGDARDVRNAESEATYRDTMDEATISAGTGEISESEWRSIERTAAEQFRNEVAATQAYYIQHTAPYQEEFFDITSERGDSPLFGIHTENPYGKTSTSGFFSSFGKQEGAPTSISTGVPSYDVEDVFTPENDPEFKAYMEQNPTASVDTNNTTIVDQLFPETVAPEMTGDTLSMDNRGYGDLVFPDGTIKAPQQEQEVPQDNLLDGDLVFDEGIVPQDELLNGMDFSGIVTGDPDPLPEVEPNPIPEDDAVFDPEPEPLPTSTPTGGGGGLPTNLPKETREILAEEEEEIFRLARVMQVMSLDERQAQSVRERIAALLEKRSRYATGDITGGVDKKATADIQREVMDPDAPRKDPIQAAIEASA